MTERTERRHRFTFTESEAEALVQSSLNSIVGRDRAFIGFDREKAFHARAKLITWLLSDPSYTPPAQRRESAA